jgi:hypothetical protein
MERGREGHREDVKATAEHMRKMASKPPTIKEEEEEASEAAAHRLA